MTAGWGARTARAAMFAAVCVLLAALGHAVMSGQDVAWWTLAAALAVTGAAGWCLAGRERGLPLVVSVVVAAQTALHGAFSLAHAGTGPVGAAHPHPHMGHTDPAGLTAHAGHDSSSAGMVAAHLLAALLCGLWLACGERAVFRLLRVLAGRLAAPLRLLLVRPVPPRRPLPRPRRDRDDRSPRLLLLVCALTRRGPPAGTAVL
ncbi:hypothetical protein [Streptomyces sp. CRN 30]|uniref:hypothetical protein n=1 Tax=Streptomyces sp. CRN 30 TaxID=3075613 RepID=UPI002A82F1EF|nr:hypothetical protein [Streptomyces sp. CRN 30]